MKVTVKYPGSVGEVLQGRYKGNDVLFSCPINLYTEVTISESKVDEIGRFNKHSKAQRFMKNLLNEWGYTNLELDISINSSIPQGKGFASSTADLCGTYLALLKITGREYNEDELIENCLKIEPTDSIIFNKATIFDYRKGKFKEILGDYLKFTILCFVGEKTVDTVSFNNSTIPNLSNVDDLVEELKEGLVNKDLKRIANVSTRSIIRNQHRLKYEILEKVLEINNTIGGLGIIGAHSGDMLGIILKSKKGVEEVNLSDFNIDGYKTIIVETITNSFK